MRLIKRYSYLHTVCHYKSETTATAVFRRTQLIASWRSARWKLPFLALSTEPPLRSKSCYSYNTAVMLFAWRPCLLRYTTIAQQNARLLSSAEYYVSHGMPFVDDTRIAKTSQLRLMVYIAVRKKTCFEPSQMCSVIGYYCANWLIHIEMNLRRFLSSCKSG